MFTGHSNEMPQYKFTSVNEATPECDCKAYDSHTRQGTQNVCGFIHFCFLSVMLFRSDVCPGLICQMNIYRPPYMTSQRVCQARKDQ